MSTRKLTTQQYEDQTVLDTESLEQGIHDIFETFNNIGPDIDVSSMLQKQVVWGNAPPQLSTRTLPPTIGVDTVVAPFLPVIPVDTSGQFIRSERLKSNDPYGITCVPPSSLGVEYVTGWNWQMAFWTEEPILVTDLDIFMHMQQNYFGAPPLYTDPQSFIWQAGAPAPLSDLDPLEDIVVSMTVDSPNNQQDASQVALALHKNFFALNSQRLLEQDVWSTADMQPTLPAVPSLYPLEFTRGFEIQAKEVNAPIPAKSRVRINIFVPNYYLVDSGEVENEWTEAQDLGYQPWRRFMWSNTLTFLERKTQG